MDLKFHLEAKSETKKHINYPTIIRIGRQHFHFLALKQQVLRKDFFRNCLKVKSQPSKAILRHLRKRLQKIYGFKTIMSVEFRLHEDPQSTYLSQSI